MGEGQQAASGAGAEQAGVVAARVARSEADIEVLRKEAAEAAHRAGVAEGHADSDRHRIEALEARAVVDREMLEELSAEGVIHRDRTANLEVALQSARLIGAAVGIIMARSTVSEATAFATLRKASRDSNCRVRDVAEEIVITGDVSALPPDRTSAQGSPRAPD